MASELAVIGNKIQTREEAIKMANEVERLEAIVKVMKNQMRDYVNQNGPIETDTVVWNIREIPSYSFSAEQLKTVAENIVLEGKNPWELMTISYSTLQKLGWSDAVIDQMGKKKVSTRFESRSKRN